MTFPGTVPHDPSKFETGLEEALVGIIEDIETEFRALTWPTGRPTFAEVKKGDLGIPERGVGCYIGIGSENISEDYVGARSLTQHLPLVLIIRGKIDSPKDLLTKQIRYWGKVNDTLKANQTWMVTRTIGGVSTNIVQVQHRRIVTWRPFFADVRDELASAVDIVCEYKTR